MPRIEPLPADDWSDGYRAVYGSMELSAVELDTLGINAHLPATSVAYARAAGTLIREGTLGDRLRELVRIRVAFCNQCRSCMAVRYRSGVSAGVDDDLVCSIARPEESDDVTDAERSALRFAELMATDHLAIDDAVYADLRRHFDDAQLVELGTWTAICVGFGRFAATWSATDHLPEHYTADGLVEPWGAAGVVVN